MPEVFHYQHFNLATGTSLMGYFRCKRNRRVVAEQLAHGPTITSHLTVQLYSVVEDY